MFKRSFSYYKNFFTIKKFKKFNKFLFNKKLEKKDSRILVEFNAFHSSHCYISLISNYLAIKHNSRIVAFNNYKLTAIPFEESILKKIKWYLGKIFKLKFFGIYCSFGTTEFINPSENKENNIIAKKIFNEVFSKIYSKSDITKIEIDNILLGDLIYDGYLKLYSEVTIDYNSQKFQRYLFQFILVYLFWKNYFNNNNVKSVLGVHNLYAYGIIYRLAFSNNIEVFTVLDGRVFRLNRKNQFQYNEYKNFKNFFSEFKEIDKDKLRQFSKISIEKRLNGELGNNIKELITTKSAFSKPYDNKNKVLSNNNKLKVLIATHQVGDPCNILGENFFPDFYEWLNYLSRVSKETDYEWYIKDHPYYSDLKYAKSLDRTSKLTRKIVKENNKLIHLESDISHHQIINEKIDFVLTIYGTIAFEYAYFGIPVVMATKNCPTSNYSFNILPDNFNDYENILKNLKNIKFKINRNEVLEYYFMKYIYNDYNSLFEGFSNFLDRNNNFDAYANFKFYDYWIRNVDMIAKEKMVNVFHNFYLSNDHSLNLSHNKLLLNKIKNSINI